MDGSHLLSFPDMDTRRTVGVPSGLAGTKRNLDSEKEWVKCAVWHAT